jgi:cytochrome c-type biogenesis protein CcmE
MPQRNRVSERLTLVLAALASVAYLGGGIALIASSQSFVIFPPPGPLRYGLAALLIWYGGSRAFRAYYLYKDSQYDDD